MMEMIANNSLILFRANAFPKEVGDIAVTSIRILKSKNTL
jgi:hypothetical protein